MDCEKCGACCAHAGDGAVNGRDNESSAPSDDAHCVAFRGDIGQSCGCAIYERRPIACREFTMGSMECLDTRRIAGL